MSYIRAPLLLNPAEVAPPQIETIEVLLARLEALGEDRLAGQTKAGEEVGREHDQQVVDGTVEDNLLGSVEAQMWAGTLLSAFVGLAMVLQRHGARIPGWMGRLPAHHHTGPKAELDAKKEKRVAEAIERQESV